MSMVYEWGDDSRRYIHVCVDHGVTTEEIFETLCRMRDELEDAPTCVDLVCEFSPRVKLPHDIISAMPEVADRINAIENLGKIYVVGAKGFTRTVVEVFSAVFYPLHHVQAGPYEPQSAVS
jgi:hypothetical protein